MECDRIKDMMSPFLDGELNEQDERSVREHLDMCAECRKDMADLRRVSTLYRNLADPEPPTDFNDRVYAAIGRIKLGRTRSRLFPVTVLASAATLVLLASAIFVLNQRPATEKSQIAKAPQPQRQVADALMSRTGKRVAMRAAPPVAEKEAYFYGKQKKGVELFEHTKAESADIENIAGGNKATVLSQSTVLANNKPAERPAAAETKVAADVFGDGDTNSIVVPSNARAMKERAAGVYAQPEPEQTVRVADRTFHLVDGVWTDMEYDGTSKTQDIVYGSDEYAALRGKSSEIGKYLALGPKVIFQIDGNWYRIVEKED
ncbi:MAG: zf-HC2 domain-containing protein [Candidatus Hydrogenedentes bacterium]|nr:zf-HC2 domain-containing protein [Candidatus Hydrogenedentota bacterium]